MRERIPLYDAKVTANKVGAFIRDGFAFDVVRPGVDIQGRNRAQWTQVVWKGVPIWETKLACRMEEAMRRFLENWDKWFLNNPELAKQALESESASRLKYFKDGVSGIEMAASYEDPQHQKDYAG